MESNRWSWKGGGRRIHSDKNKDDEGTCIPLTELRSPTSEQAVRRNGYVTRDGDHHLHRLAAAARDSGREPTEDPSELALTSQMISRSSSNCSSSSSSSSCSSQERMCRSPVKVSLQRSSQSNSSQATSDRNDPISPRAYMRTIAADARAWSTRALARSAPDGDVDPVAMLLPDAGQRVGGPAGRGPLLRRLQTPVPGMLDDFVCVTVSRPGPLYVRLKPDSRGLVMVNNFDMVPDDPHTGCPVLGPVESAGTVAPGDAVASVNREVLLGRSFSESVRCIKEASLNATQAEPCLLCFRKAFPGSMEAKTQLPPRNLEEEKRRLLDRVLRGEPDGILDERRLRGITSTGVPDEGGLRPLLWRLLLRALPWNRTKWEEHLRVQRARYARFVHDLILEPAANVTRSGGPPGDGQATDPESYDNVSGCEKRLAPNAPTLDMDDVLGPGVPECHRRGDDIASDDLGSTVDGAPDAVTVARALLGSGTEEKLASESVEGGAEEGAQPEEEPTCQPSPHGLADECDAASHVAADRSLSDVEGAAPTPMPPKPAPDVATACGDSRRTNNLMPTHDDPLSDKDSSGWAALWSDKELMQTIEQDVVRTMPDLAFYAGGSRGNDDGDVPRSAANEERYRKGRERHRTLARILFIHAKLNQAESYTQGMNEIVATLYFVMETDTREEWRQHSEADTFFCFTNLMAEIRDVFISSLDDSESGLHGKMEAFSKTLRQHDPELADHMVKLALDPRFFALRWFTTLLSREFDLPDTIRLWDSLFASRDRSTFLVFVFVTLLLGQREALLTGDFASNLQLLQAYPPTDIPDVLAQSEALRLFSARGEAARTGVLTEQRAREAAEGAKVAAEQVNAAARRFWNAATDLAAGAAERVAGLSEGNQFQQQAYFMMSTVTRGGDVTDLGE